jgi:hypothetical protein
MIWTIAISAISFFNPICAQKSHSAGKPGKSNPTQADTVTLEKWMKIHPAEFGAILANSDSLRIQIIYTQIDRDEHDYNKPVFKDFYYHLNERNYFYPASTVKMPVAFLALKKLHELHLQGLDRNSTMITDSAYEGQSRVFNDPTSEDGRPSIGQYIKKIFLVSDNEAFNRLYEFLGQEYINKNLEELGCPEAEIRHRLQISLSLDENAHTNPVFFYDPSGKTIYCQGPVISRQPFSYRHDSVGQAFFQDGKLVNRPMDFSFKNRISLNSLHRILRSVIFPDAVIPANPFGLIPDDYRFLYQYMSEYPSESTNPSYDTFFNRDAYCKFLYWGSDTGRLPKTIRIFNKVGDAYGFLTDICYFADFTNHVEFMLSATIYCNRDGVLNDDKYDYDSVGYPFLKKLGRLIYQQELKRKKSHIPDLSAFQLDYH